MILIILINAFIVIAQTTLQKQKWTPSWTKPWGCRDQRVEGDEVCLIKAMAHKIYPLVS